MKPHLAGVRSALETVTTVAMLLASCVLVWVALGNRPAPADAGAADRVDPRIATYEVGERIGAIPGLEPASSDTLLLYVRSGCPYCTDSMPFYRQLQTRGSSVRVVGVGPEPLDVLEAYFSSHRVRLDRVLSVPPGTLRLPGTPVLVLIDQDQAVRNLWLGRLSADREAEVLAALSRD